MSVGSPAPPVAEPGPAGASPPAPPPRSHRKAIVLIAVAAALLVVASVAAALVPRHKAVVADGKAWDGTLDQPAFAKPDFTLTDTSGHPYDFGTATKGQLTLLYFGYTNCPDACPIHMATLAQALNDLPGVSAKVVFVTTDPARDSPQRIRQWLDQYDSRFVGLTGSIAALGAAQRAAGVTVAQPDPPDANGKYAVGHAASVLAYTPDGLQHLSYPFGTTENDWVHDLRQLQGVGAWNRSR